jgi:hypothetical protein
MSYQFSTAEQVSRIHTFTPTRPSLLFGSLSRIPAQDAMDLRWRFTNPALVSVPEPGFSGQLERMAVFSFGVRPCIKCGGSSRGEGRDGTGWAPAGKYSKLSYAVALRQYRSEQVATHGLIVLSGKGANVFGLLDLGDRSITQQALADLYPSLPEEACKQCPACKGDGVVHRKTRRSAAITARPMGSSVDGNGTAPSVDVDVVALIRYGRVSRLLERVAGVSLLARVLIEVYFSDGGGSVDALWEFTQSGLAMLQSLPNPRGLPPDALFGDERNLQRTQPTEARRHALARVEAEANREWDAACRVWNDQVKE